MLKQSFQQPPNYKVLFNIGASFDVPTGFYVKGAHGEHLLLGGLGGLTAVVGRGNRYKSTILHYMMLSAMDRLMSTAETSASTFDTEINIHEHALQRFVDRFDNLKDKDIINDGTWVITDKTQYSGNKWYEQMKEYIKAKKALGAKVEYVTPFLSRDKSTPMKIIIPTFSEVDSFSEFDTDEVGRMQDENELGESGGNTIHMRLGLAKTRFMMETPALCGSVNHYLLMTAHLGDNIQVAQGPYAAPPPKKLQHMKQGDKIKGVTDKFFFLMNNCWHAVSAERLDDKDKFGPKYPTESGDDNAGDLNVVGLTLLRGKSGPSGFTLNIVVSQSQGVLPSMTEFYHIKEVCKNYGISGNDRNYALDLLPEVGLSRTTVRGKIDNDPKLRRALNITSELEQLSQYHRGMKEILCEPKELYEDLKKLGYDWDMLLSQTRGWWTVNNDKHPLKFLSTVDLLMMRKEQYFPYWLESDKKTIKKAYA